MRGSSSRLSIKAASLATGISMSRLRAWEKRYAVPAPSRSGTGRRLYSDDDVALLKRMLALVKAGYGAREAAAAVRDPDTAPIQSPAVHPLTDRLTAAARHLDEKSAFDCIWDAVGELGWAAALESVIFPALREVGSARRRGLLELIHEHFLTELVRQQVYCEIARSTQPALNRGRTQVVLAAMDERDDLELLALNLLVRQAGATTLYLGAGVSGLSLFELISHLLPAAVVISCQAESTRAGIMRIFMSIGSKSRATRFFFTGAGFPHRDEDLPGTVLPSSPASAASLVRSPLD